MRELLHQEARHLQSQDLDHFEVIFPCWASQKDFVTGELIRLTGIIIRYNTPNHLEQPYPVTVNLHIRGDTVDDILMFTNSGSSKVAELCNALPALLENLKSVLSQKLRQQLRDNNNSLDNPLSLSVDSLNSKL